MSYPKTDEEMIVPKIEKVAFAASRLLTLAHRGKINYASPEFHTGEMSDALKNAGKILEIALRDLLIIEGIENAPTKNTPHENRI